MCRNTSATSARPAACVAFQAGAVPDHGEITTLDASLALIAFHAGFRRARCTTGGGGGNADRAGGACSKALTGASPHQRASGHDLCLDGLFTDGRGSNHFRPGFGGSATTHKIEVPHLR